MVQVFLGLIWSIDQWFGYRKAFEDFRYFCQIDLCPWKTEKAHFTKLSSWVLVTNTRVSVIEYYQRINQYQLLIKLEVIHIDRIRKIGPNIVVGYSRSRNCGSCYKYYKLELNWKMSMCNLVPIYYRFVMDQCISHNWQLKPIDGVKHKSH